MVLKLSYVVGFVWQGGGTKRYVNLCVCSYLLIWDTTVLPAKSDSDIILCLQMLSKT